MADGTDRSASAPTADAPSPPADTTLPRGLRVVVDRRVLSLDGGVLLGGAPPRMLRLAPVGRDLLADGAFTVTDTTSAALARRLLDAGVVHPVPRPGGGADPAAVTVVIPVRDRTAAVARLLAALPPDLGGTVVVDDGSVAPAALRAVADAAGARLLRQERSRGPAAARNAGLAAATTPLVAFLDSDVLPEPGWLAPLLAHLADPAVGLVAPRVVALDPGQRDPGQRDPGQRDPGQLDPGHRRPVRRWIARYEAVRASLDLGPDPAPVVPRSRVAYVPSAALLVRRAAVGDGFVEEMRVAEDVDLVLRLHAAGWRMRYEPSSRVAHDHRTTLPAWWLRKAYYGTGAAPLALRHPGAVPPMVLSPWSAAVAGLLLLRRPLAAAAVAAWAAERLAGQLPRLAQPRRAAARIVGLGVVGAVAQTADALNRHYWPLTALACAVSSRARRTVAVVALAEGIVDWVRHRGRDPEVRPGPIAHLVAHRLDDLAYGAGLWWGALRHRTLAPLRPTGPRLAVPTRGTRRADTGESPCETGTRSVEAGDSACRDGGFALSRRGTREPGLPAPTPGSSLQRPGRGSTMTGPDDADRSGGEAGEVPEVAGMPSMDPPSGGPNADPDAPDPGDLVPGRPGPPPGDDTPDAG